MSIITVFGATGVQGGGVVNAILAHPKLSKTYTIRGITRNPDGKGGQALAAKGVQVQKADLNDVASVKAAVKGSHAVFAVTNYWEKASKEIEVQQGRHIADACVAEGVQHLVWSALPHVDKLTDGVLRGMHHFDSKAEVAEYIESSKGPMVATHFMPGFYMQNFKGLIQVGQDGAPTLTMPWDADATRVPLLDAATDTGTYVAAVLAHDDPKALNGRFIQACSQWRSPNEIVDTISKHASQTVKFQTVPEDAFRNFLPAAVAGEFTENMILVRDYSYFGKGSEANQADTDRILDGAKKVTWEDFVARNGPWEWKKGEASLYEKP